MTTMLNDAAALASLLEEENSALLGHDFQTTAKVAGEKRRLIERLGAGLGEYALHPQARAGDGGALRTRLQTALAENKRLLEAAVKVQADVIAVVLRAIETPAAAQYRLDGTHAAAAAPPVALATRA